MRRLTIHGRENYGDAPLAAELARRGLELNRRVGASTGRMMEKYNVIAASLQAGGGECFSHDGFGWTNGVYPKLAHTHRDL